ncbi:Ldh family oxidoreductase [Alicycliphilus denitrificans]|uniref:Malate dehydrogenase n=2 Tax=Alicycliphilus denitrificans TaxID=179636 RepID=F4G4X9_ALIDK|nr:Ldh family oxidoreductase [Alicycliphilus denitrificans]ADV00320.1 Malate/L-lactate dehydrogenase [Alicycliphilus denitrificans BC]AEB85252.1 Malate dehydrogenase [Alicycliphilus denitrificans K601]QKD43899.1 Ldh family oxidoreductase [Alicycliphilus denitrificans]
MSTPHTSEAPPLFLPVEELLALAGRVFLRLGLSLPHAEAMARTVVAGQRDECHSHGVYRILSCAHTVRAGKVALQAEPVLTPASGAVVRVDARYGFSPLAFERGLPALVAAARQHGIGALAIQHCFHFSALWPEIEAITAHGLAALALTPSHAWVAPAGGRQPVFGTNPIAFGWPRPGQHPFVFDFATSAIARGDLELHRRAGTPLPPGCGVDAQGRPSTDPVAVAQGAMLAFGGHKGSALSAMVELMAGALIGDWTSAESLAFDAGDGATPCHGELILAFDPARLGGGDLADQQQRAERLFDAITGQGARLPSQRRFEARARSLERGVAVPRALHAEILALAD